jgi:serine/threonine protein kinase
MPLAAGVRLGPYEILGPAGAGGMGEVYRARDTRLDRTVAIKVLPAEIHGDHLRRGALRREAQAIAALSHPHICALHDVGCEADVDFLVMEHLVGETLQARLKRGPLPLREALRIGIEVGEALAAAHRAGIVHRDLKPSNIMLTRSGVKLLDFGLAKRQGPPGDEGSVREAATMTQPGMLVGTLLYMAPEQVEGRTVDVRTDVFALGGVLYEMIAGRPAFRGDSSPTLIASILGAPPPPPSTLRSGVPAPLDRVITTCLVREPDERWQSAADLVRVLRWISLDLESRPPGAVPGFRWGGWRMHAAWAALAAILLLIPWPHRSSTDPPRNPRPVIVLMDSPLPGRVYDPRTLAEGGTNADDVTDALRELPVVIQKENTSALWHREEQVLRMNPDLVVTHLSCLFDFRPAGSSQEAEEHLFQLAASRLVLFFGYLAKANPNTRFIVYSRGRFEDPTVAGQWVEQAEARFPALRGRLRTFDVPGGQATATFRDPQTARLVRDLVRETLGLRASS